MISRPYCALPSVCLRFLSHVRDHKIYTFRNLLHEINSKFQNNRHYGCKAVDRSFMVRSFSYHLMEMSFEAVKENLNAS